MIKVISFDLWGTLIKGSSEYKHHRSKYLSGFTKRSELEINIIIKTVKDCFVYTSEKFGVHIDKTEIYTMIFNKLGISNEFHSVIIKNLMDMFIEYPPVLYDNNTYSILNQLQKHYKLFLISNTMLADGKTLRDVLYAHNINVFEQTIFSDEYNCSKPSPKIFDAAFSYMNCDKKEVLHIGDNITTDITGGSNYGFNTMLLNKGTSIDVLKSLPLLTTKSYSI